MANTLLMRFSIGIIVKILMITMIAKIKSITTRTIAVRNIFKYLKVFNTIYTDNYYMYIKDYTNAIDNIYN